MSTHAAHEVQAELLSGTVVRDRVGHRVGRLAEIVAHKDGDELIVTHYIVGASGWLRRTAVHGLGLRIGSLGRVYHVTWDQLDLSDPSRPVTTCLRDELKREALPPRKRGLKRRPARRLR